jgi:hypothetical protein
MTMNQQSANELKNVIRRVSRARKFPENTCPASRHLHIMAETLAKGEKYHMLDEEPEYCAGTMFSVLEALLKTRTELAELKKKPD